MEVIYHVIGPDSTSKLHQKVAHGPQIPNFLKYNNLGPQAPIYSIIKCALRLSEKDKTMAWLIDGSALYAGTTLK